MICGEQVHDQCHSHLHESSTDDEYVLVEMGAVQPRRSLVDNPKVRAVSFGGWLVIEKWIKPSLFDGIPDGDLLVSNTHLCS